MSPPAYDDDFFQIRYTTPKIQEVAPDPCHARPRGVDDGFNGPNSECASSVVAVAHRMLRGHPPMQRQRRNSKSLPTSPLGKLILCLFYELLCDWCFGFFLKSGKRPRQVHLLILVKFISYAMDDNFLFVCFIGSPETRRRLANRFFTLEENKDQGSSTSSILEAISREPEIRAKSYAPEHLPKVEAETLTPKPSEYREMNFWSPTSM